MPVVFGWREEDGPPPRPEAVEVATGTAILCPWADGANVLLLGRPDSPGWMVYGKCSREDVIRVAESLP